MIELGILLLAQTLGISTDFPLIKSEDWFVVQIRQENPEPIREVVRVLADGIVEDYWKEHRILLIPSMWRMTVNSALVEQISKGNLGIFNVWSHESHGMPDHADHGPRLVIVVNKLYVYFNIADEIKIKAFIDSRKMKLIRHEYGYYFVSIPANADPMEWSSSLLKDSIVQKASPYFIIEMISRN